MIWFGRIFCDSCTALMGQVFDHQPTAYKAVVVYSKPARCLCPDCVLPNNAEPRQVLPNSKPAILLGSAA